MHTPIYKALSIAGFDGSGGAGIQADVKTFSALGCYATTVLTSLPVQNTRGVRSIYDVTTQCIEEQLKAILDDIQLDVVKIGMLHRYDIVAVVAEILRHYKIAKIVLDPVMIAKSGDLLLLPNAIEAIKRHLFPITTILTPNLPEASELLGREIVTKGEMELAALDLLKMGPQAVVVKGGHLDGNCDDCLVVRDELNSSTKTFWFHTERIPTKNTHGTGCTFSAAIASFLAFGNDSVTAVKLAKDYLTAAVKAGAELKIGQGNGPVHHFHALWNNLLSPNEPDEEKEGIGVVPCFEDVAKKL